MVKDEKQKAKKNNGLKLLLELFILWWRCAETDGFIKSLSQRWWKTRNTSLDLHELFTGSGRPDLNQKTPSVGFQYEQTFFLQRGEVFMDLDESIYPTALKLWVKCVLNWGSLQSFVNNSSGSVTVATALWHLWAGGQPFSLTVVWIIGKSLTRCYFMATATILPWAAADASFPFNRMRTMWLWIICCCLCCLHMSTFAVFHQPQFELMAGLTPHFHMSSFWDWEHFPCQPPLFQRPANLLIFFFFWLPLCARNFTDRQGTVVP